MTARQLWVLILTGVPALMVSLDILCLTTALPVVRVEFGSSVSVLEWAVTGYNLAFAIFLLPFSTLGDRIGRGRAFALGVGLFTLGSLGCALAAGPAWLITARVVQGFGAAFIVPLGLALVSASFPPERRGRALGIGAIGTGLATLSGPVIGAVMTEFLSWHWIFWINVPLGLAVIPLVLLLLRDSDGDARGRIDILGLSLIALVVCCAVAAVTPDVPAGLRVVAVGVAAAALLGLIGWQRRAVDPIIPRAFLRQPAITLGNLATLAHSAVVLGAVFWMAQLFHDGLGYDTVRTGLALLPWTGTMPLVGPLAGRLVDRVGPAPVLIGGLVLQAVGMGWLAVAIAPTTPYLLLVVPLVLAGIGGAAVFPAAQSMVLLPVGDEVMGRASGINAVVREFGGVLGIAVVSAGFVAAGGFESPGRVVDGVRAAFLICTGCALAGAVLGMIAARRGRTAAAPDPEPSLVTAGRR